MSDKKTTAWTTEPASEFENSPVIADIQVNVHMDEKTRFLLDYTTCCMCGSDLDFTHATNFIRQETVEHAQCPNCQVQTKKATHRLQ